MPRGMPAIFENLLVRALVQSSEEHLASVINEGTEGGMPPQAMPEEELAALLEHLQTMRPRRFRGPRRGVIQLSDGGQIEGLILGMSSFDVNIRTDDGKPLRLVRQGTSETFTPVSVEPKMDWRNYDNGDNNRYLAAELRQRPPRVILALGSVAHQAVLMACGLKRASLKFAHHAVHALPPLDELRLPREG